MIKYNINTIVNKIKTKRLRKTKKITALALAVSVTFSGALASILGSEQITGISIETAEGTTYVQNSFLSDQNGVGLQTENYYVYKPNQNVVPKIINDAYLYGKTDINQMVSIAKMQGYYPLMLMNSDFFSFQTGVPMGHQISDGIIITKDSSTQDAIGIMPDGTAFINSLWIETTIEVNGAVVPVENINKYRQPYALYMYTDKFSDTTRASSPGVNVVIGNVTGDLKIGSKVTGTIEKVYESDGAIPIEKGKIVLSADNTASAQILDRFWNFTEGAEVTIQNNATGDNRWAECVSVQGSIGGRLLKDGTVQDIDEAAAPRSAVGITGDGNIVFYTIDGRQSGYSYGVRLKTLANRLKELGCTDALNFDGGGSTSICGLYPGKTEPELLNKPSDGKPRKVTTFFALCNMREPTGEAAKLHIYPYGGNYLTGTTQKFTTLATDTADHAVNYNGAVTYSADGGATVLSDGNIKLAGSGSITINAKSDNIEGSTTVNVFSNPDSIKIYNGNKNITGLNIGAGKSVNLTALASVGNKTLISDSGAFTWAVENDGGKEAGKITSDGVFTASQISSSGRITVTGGNKTVSIPVTVSGDKSAEYTDGEFSVTDGAVVLTLKNADGITVNKENIFAYADGTPCDFEYDGNVITVKCDNLNDNMHKIKIKLTNSLSHPAVFNKTIGTPQKADMFADSHDHWASEYIAYMYGQKTVNGYDMGDGTFTFQPSKNVTRAEFAVMTANYLKTDDTKYKDVNTGFADSDKIPSWAAAKINALYSLGIMNGKTYGDEIRFDSTQNITRAEAVTVFARILGVSADKYELNFTDSKDIPDYANPAFKTLLSFSAINGYEDNTIRPLGLITRAEAVKLLYEIY